MVVMMLMLLVVLERKLEMMGSSKDCESVSTCCLSVSVVYRCCFGSSLDATVGVVVCCWDKLL